MGEIRENSAITGVNLDNNPSSIPQGQLTYALNAVVEGFDGKSIAYQNEQGNTFCGNFPTNMSVIGKEYIPNRNITVVFLTDNVNHEIGIHNPVNCTYTKIIDGECLNFHKDSPIHKLVTKIVENNEVEIYWADPRNPMRYMNIDNPPYITVKEDCDETVSNQIDCNRLRVQPNVLIPKIVLKEITDGGDLKEGTYQFAIQYANGRGDAYTSFYIVSNPISLGNPAIVSSQFDAGIDKSIVLDILNIDNSNVYEYVNIAVVKKINNIPSIELIDTMRISGNKLTLTYSGQSKTDIRLSPDELFERYTLYSKAGDVIASGDIIIWSELWTKERVNYQKIWNKVELKWESWVLPYSKGETYAKAENTFNYKGYMRDEIYALEGAFLLDDGTTTDYFHIPSRKAEPFDLEIIENDDAFDNNSKCEPSENSKPRWKVYNTASVLSKYTPVCPENPTPTIPPTQEVPLSGKIAISCSDNNCTNQGLVSLKIDLDYPLVNEAIFHIGMITHETMTGNNEAVGYDIFSLPSGVLPNTYYSYAGPNVPFQIKIPAGVTSITIPEKIMQIGQIYNPPNTAPWICHNCLFPIEKLYIKGVGINVNFSANGNFELQNVHVGPVSTVPQSSIPSTPPATGSCADECYVGPYAEGRFAYHESTDLYPCDEEIWGELANTPIRHHKFPDSLVSPHHDNIGNVYPIGIKIDIDQLKLLIDQSDLSEEQKKRIVGFTIGRGNRAANKTVIAKGLLYNVGVYKKEDQEYYYPNYPYNDLREDPFILSDRLSVGNTSGGGEEQCIEYVLYAGTINRNGDFEGEAVIKYTNCARIEQTMAFSGRLTICSLTEPDIISGVASFEAKEECGQPAILEDSSRSKTQLSGFETDLSKERFTFHSPDTHFFQPFLGSELRLETVEHGISQGHFVQVKNHAKYGFISKKGYTRYIIPIANAIGALAGLSTGTYGAGALTAVAIFTAPAYDGGRAAITVFQSIVALIEIAEKVIPKLNFAYQFNSIGRYDNLIDIQNSGNKVRQIEFSQYITSGFQSVNENRNLNNYARESSVFIRINKKVPYTHEIGSPKDSSRWILSEEGICTEPTKIKSRPISSYYGSIKKNIPNPYGTLYSYETISTGFSQLFKDYSQKTSVVFGGDCFITKFALKRKQAYFFDNRVNVPDESNVDYRDFFNVGYTKYWISTDYTGGGGRISQLYGIKQNSFDCQDDEFIYQKGKFYLFSYGIPYFFCESEVNVDLRKATNNNEGDYYPRVSTGIPDEWLQEVNVPIIQDNTYSYNKTYSTQNKENVITHIPEDFDPSKDAVKYLPNRCFYSEPQGEYVNYKRNNWLIYRPISYFDFPLNYGKLIALESIETKQILARFENKSLVYNALLTIPSTVADVYVGQELFSRNIPALDFAEIGFGFNGTLNKIFIKTERGNISIDAQKGQVFLMKGSSIEELSSQKYNWSKFFSRNLPFKIKEHFNIPIDNHFQKLGLHGVYDMQNDRIIITKFDYEPIVEGIIYENNKFYFNDIEISLQDTNYFCNRSFTCSFNFVTNSWISFHSYLPNYYVGTGTNFLSGIDGSIWKHNQEITKFNNFYGDIHAYILEYPFQYKIPDEIIQSVSDYTKVLKITDEKQFIETNDIYFNKANIYNNQASTGDMILVPKPKNNMGAYLSYPKYTPQGKEILFTKSGSMYNYNSITNQVKDSLTPFWKKSCKSLSLDKELISSNLHLTRVSYKESLIRAKESKIRHTLDNTSDYRLISQFIITNNQNSYI